MLGSGGSCRLACGEVFTGREENKDSTDNEMNVLVKLLNLSKTVLHSLNMPPPSFFEYASPPLSPFLDMVLK